MRTTHSTPLGTILLAWWKFKRHHPRAHAVVIFLAQLIIIAICALAAFFWLLVPDRGLAVL